jgi:hypothetical protein
MTNNNVAAKTKTAAIPAHLKDLVRELDPPKARVIFAIDATASRQPTWDMAAKLTAEMFRATARSGGLQLQLIYYRGRRNASHRSGCRMPARSSPQCPASCVAAATHRSSAY